MKEINADDVTALGNLLRAIQSLAEGTVSVRMDELLGQILDDGRLAEFAGPLGAHYGLSEMAIAHLRTLRDAIDAYEKTLCSFSDRPVEASGPRWDEVRACARAVVRANQATGMAWRQA